MGFQKSRLIHPISYCQLRYAAYSDRLQNVADIRTNVKDVLEVSGRGYVSLIVSYGRVPSVRR